jgi:hypothetical protein
MEIESPQIIKTDDCAIVQSEITYKNKKEKLWYSVPTKYGDSLVTETIDGFLVGLLPLAMKIGENIKVQGTISKKLYFNLTNSYQTILKLVHPYLKKIEIVTQDLTEKRLFKKCGSMWFFRRC